MPTFPISFSLTINGVQKHPKAGRLEIRQVMNGRGTASFDILSEDRSYRVQNDDTVSIVENGVTIFGGKVNRPQERALAGPNRPGIRMPVSATDFNSLLERRVALTTIPAGTMKAAFEQLRSEYLDDYGTTLNVSQVDGPDLPYIEFGGWKLPDAFNHLLLLTANAGSPAQLYTYWIDFDNVLTVFLPSTQSAPFDLLGDDLPEVVGDIEVEESRDSTYANRVIARIPATTTAPDIYVYAENFDESGTYGKWEKYLVFHDIPTEAVAQERVNAELAKSSHAKRIVRYRTFESGLQPGMEQVIDVPARNVDAVGVISEIVTRDFGRDRLIREVTVTIDGSGTNLGRTYGDVYKDWNRQGDGTGTGQVQSSVTSPADPDTSVQFNDSGKFGGDEAFMYEKTGKSLKCGGGDTSITAADAASCFVFGYDCHISEP